MNGLHSTPDEIRQDKALCYITLLSTLHTHWITDAGEDKIVMQCGVVWCDCAQSHLILILIFILVLVHFLVFSPETSAYGFGPRSGQVRSGQVGSSQVR